MMDLTKLVTEKDKKNDFASRKEASFLIISKRLFYQLGYFKSNMNFLYMASFWMMELTENMSHRKIRK